MLYLYIPQHILQITVHATHVYKMHCYIHGYNMYTCTHVSHMHITDLFISICACTYTYTCTHKCTYHKHAYQHSYKLHTYTAQRALMYTAYMLAVRHTYVGNTYAYYTHLLNTFAHTLHRAHMGVHHLPVSVELGLLELMFLFPLHIHSGRDSGS